jgi:hypothetical protein
LVWWARSSFDGYGVTPLTRLMNRRFAEIRA